MVDLKKKPRKYYSEIGQSLPIKFAFVNKVTDIEYEEVFVPFVCRDFFTDILWATENNKPVHVHGFDFDPKKNSYDKNATRLAVYFPDEETRMRFQRNGDLILDIVEIANDCDLRKEYPVDNLTLILEADAYWQSRAYLLSLYTGLIRWLSNPAVDNADDFISAIEKSDSTDGSHFRSYKTAGVIKEMLFRLREMDQFDYGVVGSTSDNVYNVHDNSGIMGVFYNPDGSKYGPHLKELYNK